MIFSNHWSDERYELGGDEEIALEFEILGGSDSPRFQLSLKHKPSGLTSTFSYHAWSDSATAWSRPEVEYPEQPPPGLYTFSSSLMNVAFERHTNHNSDFERLKTWDEKPSTYPLIIYWESEDAPVGVNTEISTES